MRAIASYPTTYSLPRIASAEHKLTAVLKKASQTIEPVACTAAEMFAVSLLVNVVVKLNECASIIQYCSGPTGF